MNEIDFKNLNATLIISSVYGSADPIFRVSENEYDFSRMYCLFLWKIYSDHKGFSIYNASESKPVFKLPWLKHFND